MAVTREQILAWTGGSNRAEDILRASQLYGFSPEDVDRAFGLAPGTSAAKVSSMGGGSPAIPPPAPAPTIQPSAPSGNANVQTMYTRESPDIEAYKLGLMEQARILSSQPPQNMPDQQVAAPNDVQRRAYDMALTKAGRYNDMVKGGLDTMGQAGQGLDAAGQGIASIFGAPGAASPFVTQAMQGLQAGTNTGLAGLQQAQGFGNQAMQGLGAATGAGQSAYQQAALQAMNAATRAQGVAGLVNQGVPGEVGGAQAGAAEAAARARAATGAAQDLMMQGGLAGQNAAMQGIGALLGADAQFDPSGAAQFMNPYEDTVVQQVLSDIQRQGDIQGNALRAQAVHAGAFGGSRQAIADSEHGRNVLDAQARAAGQLRQQGFDTAMGNAMSSFENARGRQIQTGMGIGSLGQMGSDAMMRAAGAGGQLALGTEQLAQSGALQGGQLGLSGQQLMGQLGLSAAELGGIMGLQAGQLGLSQADMQARNAALGGQLGLDMGQLGLAAGDLQSRNASGIGSLGLNFGQLGIQAGQAGGQLGLGQAQGYQNLGLAQSGIGELLQTMGLRDLEAMLNVGAQERQIRQQQLDTDYNNQIRSIYEPYQRLGFYSDILQGAPTSQQTIAQYTAPQPSMLNQLTGAATSAIGLIGAGKSAGII